MRHAIFPESLYDGKQVGIPLGHLGERGSERQVEKSHSVANISSANAG